MMGHKKCSLVEILTDSPSLNAIVSKVEQLAKLNRIVHQNCDSELAKYCRVANFRDGILILTTTSPATGHLLRFAKTELLSKLRAIPEWCHLKSINIHVRPKIAYHNTSPELPRAREAVKFYLSNTNAEEIKSTALTITSLPLQEALLRLAKFSSPHPHPNPPPQSEGGNLNGIN